MKHLITLTVALFVFTSSFAQMPQRPSPAQQEAFKRMQSIYDSLTPMQKNMFFTEVKHIMDPEVTIIQPGASSSYPPSDAIILFDGKDIDKEWEEAAWRPGTTPTIKPAVTWIVKDGAMESVKGSGSIRTKRSFNDFQMHIE